jgi:hypothetical protein
MPVHPSTQGAAGVNPASLVIYTKQSDAQVSEPSPKPTLKQRLARKFKLQREAQRLLPKKRVAGCNRHVRVHDFGEVVGRSANGRAEFINVLRCGSIWDCPVCASKICSSRSAQVQLAMDRAVELGYQVHLLTFTVPHTIHQSAKTVVSALSAARSHWKDSRAYKAHKASSGWLGEIWAYEVTYGANGWHAHCHALHFAKNPDLESLRDQWSLSVAKQGLGEVNRRGFDVRSYDGAKDYVGKWGLELELTRGDLKKSRKGGSTPFYLLEQSMKGDEKAGRLFVEYSQAFHGRPQLLWTDGLKKALEVDDFDDAQLADLPEVDPKLPHETWVLDQASWMVILGSNMRGELLYYAGKYGQVGVDALVAKLKGLDQIDEPYYRQQSR